MLVLCGTAAAIAILVLVLILGYTLFKGISYINLNILIQAAKPMGQAGGGMRNEIFGTLILVLLGSCFCAADRCFSRDLPGRIR